MSEIQPKRPPGRPPGSRNKQTLDVKELAQDYTAEAIEKLATIMRTSTNEGAQVSAIKELLDRGHGKPKQSLDVDATLTDKRAVEMTEEELLAIAAGSRSGAT